MLESIGDTLAPGRPPVPADRHDPGRDGDPRGGAPVFGDNMESVLEREFPLPDIVAKSEAVARMMKEGLLNLHRRGSRCSGACRSGAASAPDAPRIGVSSVDRAKHRDRRHLVARLAQVVGAAAVDRQHDPGDDRRRPPPGPRPPRSTWWPVVLTSSISATARRAARRPRPATSCRRPSAPCGRPRPAGRSRATTAATSSVAAPSGAARWSVPAREQTARPRARARAAGGRVRNRNLSK